MNNIPLEDTIASPDAADECAATLTAETLSRSNAILGQPDPIAARFGH